MNNKPTKINLTSDDSLFEKSLNLQKYIEDLSSQAINLTDKFSFSWAGKSNAIKSVLVPSKLTLNPEPKQSIKWDGSENLFIEGDNLEVLKLLQKAYFEKVKMIYIDPPYNTGHDFVYNDDFSAPLDGYLKQTGQKSEDGNSNTTNKETNGRYHSDWLSMMYPRLKLAWNLLREDGVIFVSIDDNEAQHLRMLMDEIFGEENFVCQFIWNKKNVVQNDATFVSVNHEYVLCFGKNVTELSFNLTPRTEEQLARYKNPDNDPRGNWTSVALQAKSGSSTYEITFDNGVTWKPVEGTYPRLSKTSLVKAYEEGRLWFGESGKNVPRLKKYLSEVQDGVISNSLLMSDDVGSTQLAKENLKKLIEANVFDTPKPIGLIQRLLQITTDKIEEDIILDFFAGSGTTGHAVLKQNQDDGGNRKFIMVQLPEKLDEKSEGFKAGYKTISDIAKERIRRVIKGYGENPQPIDSGFKVFTLSESNYPENTFVFDPEKSSEENQQAFIAYLNKAKQSQLFDKGNDTSLVYENIVKEGFSLNSKVETITIGKNKVYKISDGEQQLLACLENKLAPETVKELTDKSHKDKLFICLESSLDDTTAANLSLNLDLKTI